MANNVVPLTRPGQRPADRTPPHNSQAEQMFLGSLLANNKQMEAVVELVQPQHFYFPLHGRIYAEIVRRIIAGHQAEPVGMRLWIEADQEGAAAGGIALLVDLLKQFRGVDIASQANVITDCWKRREVAAAAKALYLGSFDPSTQIVDLMQRHADLLDATSLGADASGEISFDEAMRNTIADSKRAKARGGRADLHISTFPRTMAAVSLSRKELTILGGESGEGKSALAWGWAVDLARDKRDTLRAGASIKDVGGVAGITLEMSAEGIVARALSAASGVPLIRIIRGWTNDSEEERIESARNELAGLPIHFVALGGQSPLKIRMRLRQIRRRFEGNLALTVIDHAQLVEPDSEHAKSGGAWATGKVADAILSMCKEFDTHTIALSQVDSKEISKRQDKRPTRNDLRWSLNFRNNADNILFVYRHEAHLPAEPIKDPFEPQDRFDERLAKIREAKLEHAGKAELIIDKVRQGKIGSVAMLFDGPTTSFSEDPSYG